MNMMLIGEAGNLGTWAAPYLHPHNHLRALDVQPSCAKSVGGSIVDPGALKHALKRVDTLINSISMKWNLIYPESIRPHITI